MNVLRWAIKDSLLDYVRSMQDGRVVADGGASEVASGFEFSATANPLRFRGRVTLTGHNGLMHVIIADPGIASTPTGWVLEIADPDEPSVRLAFATLAAFDGASASGAELTEAGSDLFFGPYTAGTPVDSPTIRD